MPQEDLEQQILEHLDEKLFTAERIRQLVKQLAKELAKFRRRNNGKVQEVRRQLDDVRSRIEAHYEVIETRAVDLELVGERLRELKREAAELSQRIEERQGPKQISRHLFRTDNLQKIRDGLREIFLSNDHGLAKRYLNFLLDRIEIKGNQVRVEGDTAALCSLGLAPNEEGTADRLVAVPTVGMDWLPIADDCGNFFERFTFCAKSLILRAKSGPQKVQGSPYRHPLTLAYEFQELLHAGLVNSRAEIARRYRLSRARVTQVMSLLDLPDDIQEYVTTLPPQEQRLYSGRQLQEVAAIDHPEAQAKAFEYLVEWVSGRTQARRRDCL